MTDQSETQIKMNSELERGREAEERVYETILQAILDHRLAPGTKLVELELSQVLGASRSAVRAALSKLGHNLLVELRPNRGAIIANPSIEEARDLFDSRRVIEAATVRNVSQSISISKIEDLRQFLAKEKEAYVKGDLRTAQRLSRQFHIVLADMAGNKLLKNFLELLICRQPLLVLAHSRSPSQYCGANEHELVVDALERNDETAAVHCMIDHLNTLENQLKLESRQPTTVLAEALSSPSLSRRQSENLNNSELTSRLLMS